MDKKLKTFKKRKSWCNYSLEKHLLLCAQVTRSMMVVLMTVVGVLMGTMNIVLVMMMMVVVVVSCGDCRARAAGRESCLAVKCRLCRMLVGRK